MRKGPIIFWSIFVAAAIFRVSQTFGIKPPDIGPCIKQNVMGTGLVSEEPERKESGQILVVFVDSLSVSAVSPSPQGRPPSCKTDFLLRMKTKPYPRFKFDDRVTFKGKLLKPMNFANKDDPGRSFDYEGYLAKSDIFYEMKSAEVFGTSALAGGSMNEGAAAKVNILNYTSDHVTSFLFSLKRQFVSNLERTLGEPHAALASGLVVGEKAALGNELINDFRTVGLIHIVVLSGYNITIVGDAMRRILAFLPRVWGISIGGIGIALFGVLVGGGATVIRSCFMAGIALSADILRRDYNVARGLIFAGLIMLIQSPMILLHDPSFQLSFLATMGLILLATPIEKRLKFISDRFGMRGIISATIATQIFVSPYILYMMGNLSLIGMVVNILVLPFIPVTMLFVFLTGAIGLLSVPVAQVFAWATHILLSYELFMVQTFAKLPFASVHLSAFSKWWVVGFYAAFAMVFVINRNWRKLHSEPAKSDIKKSKLRRMQADSQFDEFFRLPKGILIDRPEELVNTGYKLHTAISKITSGRR